MKISLKFVPKGSISNIPALVQIMAWRRLGDKPLYEPMLACSPTQICVSRPQWVNNGVTAVLHIAIDIYTFSIISLHWHDWGGACSWIPSPWKTSTHLSQYSQIAITMAVDSQATQILIPISLNFVSEGPINKKPTLVQIMAWRQTGDKPLSEPMMTTFTNTYIHHLASVSCHSAQGAFP